MSVKLTWNADKLKNEPLNLPCPHPNCTGKVKASLKDIEQKKLVRCSRGHQVQLAPK